MLVECLFSPSPRHIIRVQLNLPVGSAVRDALRLMQTLPAFEDHSDLLASYLDNLGRGQTHQGIWGRKVSLTQPLKEGDRLEIYRPLLVDPKLARKQRFRRQGKGRTGLFARKRMGAVAGY